jgi:hypothetical protein
METKTNTLQESARKWATQPVLVTILGFFIVGAIASQTAQAAVSPKATQPRVVNLNIKKAQAIANAVYEDVRESGEVSGYEVAGPHDRIAHMCAEECACLSKKFTKALRHYGYDTKTVILRKTKNSLGIKMRGARSAYSILREPLFDYHIVTIVRFVGGWRVIDPVVLSSAKFEKFRDWRHRIESPVEMSVR